MLHLSDTERIMAYRALRFARGDATPLPGFDEEAYAPASGADTVPLAELVAELADVRLATLDLFRHLPAEAWTRRGTASDAPFSVRALAWVIAGHQIHHLGVLRERYGVLTPPVGLVTRLAIDPGPAGSPRDRPAERVPMRLASVQCWAGWWGWRCPRRRRSAGRASDDSVRCVRRSTRPRA